MPEAGPARPGPLAWNGTVATGPNAAPGPRPAAAEPAAPSTVPPPSPGADRTTPYGAPPAPADPGGAGPTAGFAVGGRYELGDVIARGGMGVLYAATDRTFGREVAVKLLRAEFVGTPVADRFFVEARITGQLEHPGIPPAHDVGTLPDGRPFLAMKLIKGQTLSALLRERAGPGDDLDRFLRLFEQVCLAVAFAHARGVVHRDLKPDNVMVGAFGEVQVMDWGLAKRLADPEAGPPPAAGAGPAAVPDATRYGTVLGTLAYMPPEQARGETGRLDARSDVFGLGAVLCEILTGAPPYTGPGREAVWRKAAAGDLADARVRVGRSPGPRLVNELALRCLAADPARRPAHAGEVAASLRSVLRFLEKAGRASELEDATAEADERQKAARRRAAMFTRLGLAGLLAGAAAAGISQCNAGSREEAAREWAAAADRRRAAAARELFPVALDGLARDVGAGLFRRGWDRDGREKSAARVRLLLGDQAPKDQARGHLALAAAAAATPDDALAEANWRAAADRYRAAVPEHTDVELACAALGWPFPEPLDRAVRDQARGRLRAGLHKGGLPEPLRQKAEKALAAADKAAKPP
jgi:hypothetical protein